MKARIRPPQRSRRLSASGIAPFARIWRCGDTPQRSRRLSASGIDAEGGGSGQQSTPSKKQTPFSVWYRTSPRRKMNGGGPLKEADAFQRLVYGCERTQSPRDDIPSKKQTPFSVWYRRAQEDRERAQAPSKKQTPFSVWYRSRRNWGGMPTPFPSKKQTPFSVWYDQ